MDSLSFSFGLFLTLTKTMHPLPISFKLFLISSFNTTNVENMVFMFSGCSSLKKENVKISNYGKKLLLQKRGQNYVKQKHLNSRKKAS